METFHLDSNIYVELVHSNSEAICYDYDSDRRNPLTSVSYYVRNMVFIPIHNGGGGLIRPVKCR